MVTRRQARLCRRAGRLLGRRSLCKAEHEAPRRESGLAVELVRLVVPTPPTDPIAC